MSANSNIPEAPIGMEVTLSIIKPDVTRRNLTGKVNALIENAGLSIIGQKRLLISPPQAEAFYNEHSEKPFFQELIETMTSGPIVAQLLAGQDAINIYRELMGDTDPEKALPGTIRREFGLSISENSVHGSDSQQASSIEIPFFFAAIDLA